MLQELLRILKIFSCLVFFSSLVLFSYQKKRKRKERLKWQYEYDNISASFFLPVSILHSKSKRKKTITRVENSHQFFPDLAAPFTVFKLWQSSMTYELEISKRESTERIVKKVHFKLARFFVFFSLSTQTSKKPASENTYSYFDSCYVYLNSLTYTCTMLNRHRFQKHARSSSSNIFLIPFGACDMEKCRHLRDDSQLHR